MGAACLREGCISRKKPETVHEKIAPWTWKHLQVHRKMPVFIMESRATIECLKQNGIQEEQIEWIPNFTPIRSREKIEARVNELYEPDENHILMVGRASPEKGFDLMLDAMPYIKTPNAKLHLVTGGPHYEEIERRVKEDSRLRASVVLEGILSYEKTALKYAMADLVVIPSVWMETFCLVGLEAMAYMKPVVGARVGGIKDWLLDGVTGYHFEMGNPRDLASKVDRLLSDKRQAQQMGARGYERVVEYYGADLYLSRLLGAYEKAKRVWARTDRALAPPLEIQAISRIAVAE
jgi:glycosyltransferase involved in cell wall biosynthesis